MFAEGVERTVTGSLTCVECSGTLGDPVRFCPFCGTAQLVASPAIGAPPRVEPVGIVDASAATEASVGSFETQRETSTAEIATLSQTAASSERDTVGKPRPLWRWIAAVALLGMGLVWALRPVGPVRIPFRVALTPMIDGAVTIDGVDAGNAAGPLSAPAGMHQVGFRAPHWSVPDVPVTFEAGRLATVPLIATPDRADIQIDVTPRGAGISVNGRRIGETTARVALAPGRARIVAELAGFIAAEEVVTLAPGEKRTIGLTLSKVPDTHRAIEASVSEWSEPIELVSGTSFALVFQGKLRVRVHGQTFLLERPTANLGAVSPGPLQLKSASPLPIQVDVVTSSSSNR